MNGNFFVDNVWIFYLIAAIFAAVIVGILTKTVIGMLNDLKKQKEKKEEQTAIKMMDYSKVDEKYRAMVLRSMVAPDAIDPGPNGYMILDDGGREVFVRSFTIQAMPNRTNFAYTFSGLFNFANCTSSVFVSPISDAEMKRKIDRHLVVLETEYLDAEGNSNRTRELRNKYGELEGWAEDLESGDNSFYNVGFLFTLYADSKNELDRMTDRFRSIANDKQILIANCFAVQAEAYMANAPFNMSVSTSSSTFEGKVVKEFQMDIFSVSTIYNYTQASFTHKKGVPIGHDMFTQQPISFDVYDPSHDGFTVCFFGKTGVGKSLLIKIMAYRYILHGYRFVAVDSQRKKGTTEGEFAGLAKMVNGMNFQIASDTSEVVGTSGKKKKRNILNIFDIHESKRTIMNGAEQGYEIRDLALNDQIVLIVNSLMVMIQGGKDLNDEILVKQIKERVTDVVKQLFEEAGIYNGKPDSLYEYGTVVEGGGLTSGKVKKQMPTIHMFYQKALIFARHEQGTDYQKAWDMILSGLKEYVRELYYTKKTLTFLDMEEEQYNELPVSVDGLGTRQIEINGQIEEVVKIKGIRPYYDGQSTLTISKSCRFTNIDISMLPEDEKVVARQIAFMVVNESFIKTNSELLDEADKLCAIFDEAHENFKLLFTRETLENIARTARKRHVGLFLSTQTVKEYDRTPETQDILKQAAAKFVAKQDGVDKEYLMKALQITEAHADIIVNKLGGTTTQTGEISHKHRGEFCLIDNRKVAFVKVDYFPSTEALAAETSAEGIARSISIRKEGAA